MAVGDTKKLGAVGLKNNACFIYVRQHLAVVVALCIANVD